jgi:hypothetical protein
VARAKKTGFPGEIYVWHYPDGPKSHSGWHLTADAFGAGRLVGAIEGLLAGSSQETQLFALDPVTPAVLAVPNIRRAKALYASQLRVQVAREPRQLSMHEEAGLLTVEAGPARLEELRKSIARVGEGDGDFVMTSGEKRRAPDQALFFWYLLA